MSDLDECRTSINMDCETHDRPLNLCGFFRTIARLREELAAAREETEEAKKQLGYMAEGIYRGNTISYIYDKMTCYGDQVMMAFNALRLLGWNDESNGNKERAVALKSWAESVVRERDEARARLSAMEKAWSDYRQHSSDGDEARPCCNEHYDAMDAALATVEKAAPEKGQI